MNIYDGGLFSRFANRGKPGYTWNGGVDWGYREGNGPDVVIPGTENWSAAEWRDYAADGGKIGETMFGAPKLSSGSAGGTGWLGKGGYLDLGGQVLGALSSGLAAYTGLKELDLAKDKFKFEKGLAQTNLANQAKLVNEELQNRADVGMALGGSTITPEKRQETLQRVNAAKVSGKIG